MLSGTLSQSTILVLVRGLKGRKEAPEAITTVSTGSLGTSLKSRIYDESQFPSCRSAPYNNSFGGLGSQDSFCISL